MPVTPSDRQPPGADERGIDDGGTRAAGSGGEGLPALLPGTAAPGTRAGTAQFLERERCGHTVVEGDGDGVLTVHGNIDNLGHARSDGIGCLPPHRVAPRHADARGVHVSGAGTPEVVCSRAVTGLIIATIIPLALMLGIVALGRGGWRTAPLIAIALAWGIGCTWIVIHINNGWARHYSLTSLFVLGAPIIEEVSKSFLSPLLTGVRRCSWFVDGAVIGLAAGTGFAIRENWVYLDQNKQQAVSLAVARVTSTNLMHAGCTAIVGAALAAAARRGILTRIVTGVVGLALAMGIHSGFNRLTRVSQPSAAIITAVGVLAFVYAAIIVALGAPVSARWARQDMAARGLSESEQVALAGGSSVDDLLDEFENRFGTVASSQAAELIALQRRIGVLSRGGRSDDPELPGLTEKADELRRRIGVFPMMWLRSHLPVNPAESGVWASIGASVTDAGESGEAPVLSGLWANLGAATNDVPAAAPSPPAGWPSTPPSDGTSTSE